MTFHYSSPDSSPIWMRFTPAEEDNVAIGGMVHSDMSVRVDLEQVQPEEQLSTVQKNTLKKTDDTPVSSVDRASQLTEREYHRDSVLVGKKRLATNVRGPIIGEHSDAFSFLSLMTTTGRLRETVVVDACLSADHRGSSVDCSAALHGTINRPKESFGGVDHHRYWNNPLRQQQMSLLRLRCPSLRVALCPAFDTGTGICRPDRVTSSQLSSNPPFDSDEGTASQMANRSKNMPSVS